MKKATWVTVGLIFSFVCLVMWAAAAMNYGDSVAVGKYRFVGNGESSTLVLKLDHSFQQDLQLGNMKQHGEGTWRRLGEGGIVFSKEFLIVSGDEPGPDGTTFCEMHKTVGLFVSLRLRQYHVLWYAKADSSTSARGTYTGDEPGVSATLVMNADHSFDQTLAHDGVAKHANGTWSQLANGTIEFSNAFLKTSGEPLRGDESASSMDPKGAALQIEISKSSHTAEPVFYKRLAF